MTTTVSHGRLGNQIIRNLAVSLIAEKNNMHVNYANRDKINRCIQEPVHSTHLQNH